MEKYEVADPFYRPNRPPYLRKLREHLELVVASLEYGFKKLSRNTNSQVKSLI